MLNRRLSKSTTDKPPIGALELLEALGRKRATLMERDRDLLTEQVVLEKAKIAPERPSGDVDPQRLARQMLNGFAPPEPTGKPGERLFAILHERAAVEIALDLLQQQDLQHRVLAVGEVMQRSGVEWRELTRQRALALIALRRANKACSEFRKSVTKIAGMAPGLVCDRQVGLLFGPPIVGDQGYTFLADCLRAQIVTQKDIDDA